MPVKNHFRDYVNGITAKTDTSTRAVLQSIHQKCGVSMSVLQQLYAGYRMTNYPKAMSIAKATGAVVAPEELLRAE